MTATPFQMSLSQSLLSSSHSIDLQKHIANWLEQVNLVLDAGGDVSLFDAVPSLLIPTYTLRRRVQIEIGQLNASDYYRETIQHSLEHQLSASPLRKVLSEVYDWYITVSTEIIRRLQQAQPEQNFEVVDFSSIQFLDYAAWSDFARLHPVMHLMKQFLDTSLSLELGISLAELHLAGKIRLSDFLQKEIPRFLHEQGAKYGGYAHALNLFDAEAHEEDSDIADDSYTLGLRIFDRQFPHLIDESKIFTGSFDELLENI